MLHHRLVVIEGSDIGATFPLTRPITTIGRAKECDISITAGPVSRVHAQIDLSDETVDDGGMQQATLHDKGSKNGTLINGNKVERRVLTPGDEIQIGHTVFAFDPNYEIRRGEDNGRAVVILSPDDSRNPGTITAALSPDAAVDVIATRDRSQVDDLYRRLEAVYTVSQMLAKLLAPKELTAKVVSLVATLLKADRTVLLVPKHNDEGLSPVATHAPAIIGLAPPTISRTVLTKVIDERKGVLSVNPPADERFDASKSLSSQRVYALMCVPLALDRDVLGVLYVDTTNPMREFTHDDLALLTAIGTQVAVALDNSNKYEASKTVTRVLRRRLQESTEIVGETPSLKDVMNHVDKVAPTDTTVLIRGETGTGKELIARAIHERSMRAEGPFISLNCAAMTETLLESELFGYDKGAFTGAFKDKPGKFELADKGTLFLDEVGEMSHATQTKLLRVLQERKIDRVGGTRLIAVDVRIIAATNRDLENEIKRGGFREDLFYRLSVVPVTLPPLRERSGDIPLLAKHFLEQFNHQIGRRIRHFEDDALGALLRYTWPGNIRELANTIERIVVLTDKETVGVDDVPSHIRSAVGMLPTGDMLAGLPSVATSEHTDLSLPNAIARLERAYIDAALKRANGVKVKAAELLQVSRPTLDKKLKDYDITGP